MRFLVKKILFFSIIIILLYNPTINDSISKTNSSEHNNLKKQTSVFDFINKKAVSVNIDVSEEFGNQEMFWVLDNFAIISIY